MATADITLRALARQNTTTVALVGFVTPTIWEGGVPMWIGSSTQHAVSYLVGTTILYAVAAWELVELGGRR